MLFLGVMLSFGFFALSRTKDLGPYVTVACIVSVTTLMGIGLSGFSSGITLGKKSKEELPQIFLPYSWSRSTQKSLTREDG